MIVFGINSCKLRPLKTLVALLTWLCFVVPSWAAKNSLNLFIWSEYIDPQIIADFQKAHDCKVTIDLYEDESAMMSKLQGGGAALYDVVVPPGHVVPGLIKLKLLARLRHDPWKDIGRIKQKLPNAK